MKEKRTSPGAATSELDETETAACGRAAISYVHYTPDAAHSQPSIADYLGRDRESARKGQELCAALHLDSRTLRQRIELERRNGAAIVADNRNGYWLTDDPAEAQAFVRSMRRRAHEILKTARAVEKSMGLD